MIHPPDAPPETGSAARGSAEPDNLQCPECEFSGKNERGLWVHFNRMHKELAAPQWLDVQGRQAFSAQGKASRSRQLDEPTAAAPTGLPPAPAGARSEKELQGIRQDLEGSIKTLAGFVFAFGLQTTGVALEHRADRLSYQALVFGQRSEGVMRGIEMFNQAMRSGELVELGSSLVMAAGVDVGLLHPAKEVKLGPFKVPGFVFLQPIAQDMQQVTQLREQAERLRQEYEAQMKAAGSPNGRPGQQQEAPAG
jgi:hypothetical protein